MAAFDGRRSSWRTIASIAVTVPSRLVLRRPNVCSGAGGVSRHVVGLLTLALLLCQERRHGLEPILASGPDEDQHSGQTAACGWMAEAGGSSFLKRAAVAEDGCDRQALAAVRTFVVSATGPASVSRRAPISAPDPGSGAIAGPAGRNCGPLTHAQLVQRTGRGLPAKEITCMWLSGFRRQSAAATKETSSHPSRRLRSTARAARAMRRSIPQRAVHATCLPRRAVRSAVRGAA